MTTNLQQIARQVSLINRLIELLMAHENQFEVTKYSGDFVEYPEAEFNLLKQEDKYHFVDGNCERRKKYVSRPPECLGRQIQDICGKSLTQKAWSDELVKVAREYLKTFVNSENYPIEEHFVRVYGLKTIPDLVYEICKGISNETLSSRLEAILNKYGRSLIE
jgi:hypothetical protein